MVSLKKQSHNRFQLIRKIIELSNSDSWHDAKREWCLVDVYRTQSPGECLCGHSPIKEHCIIANHENGNEVVVGNTCVKQFLGFDSDSLFQAIERVSKDVRHSFNQRAVDFFYRKDWLSKWERDFYSDTWRKRKLSPKQGAIRRGINECVLRRLEQVELGQ